MIFMGGAHPIKPSIINKNKKRGIISLSYTNISVSIILVLSKEAYYNNDEFVFHLYSYTSFYYLDVPLL